MSFGARLGCFGCAGVESGELEDDDLAYAERETLRGVDDGHTLAQQSHSRLRRTGIQLRHSVRADGYGTMREAGIPRTKRAGHKALEMSGIVRRGRPLRRLKDLCRMAHVGASIICP